MVLRIGPVPVWVAPSELVGGARAVLGWTDDAAELVAALPARVTGLLDEVDGLLLRIARAVQDVERLVGAADQVLAEVGDVAAGAATLLVRVDAVAGGAAGVVERAGRVTGAPRWWWPKRAPPRRRPASRCAARTRWPPARTHRRRGHRGRRPHGWRVGTAAGVAERAGRLVDEAATVSGTASRLLALYAPMAERAAPLAGRFVEEFSDGRTTRGHPHGRPAAAAHPPHRGRRPPILATLDRVGPDVHQLLEVLQDVRLAIQGVPGFRMLRRRGERDEVVATDPARTVTPDP